MIKAFRILERDDLVAKIREREFPGFLAIVVVLGLLLVITRVVQRAYLLPEHSPWE